MPGLKLGRTSARYKVVIALQKQLSQLFLQDSQ
jgi:hypothetical protein